MGVTRRLGLTLLALCVTVPAAWAGLELAGADEGDDRPLPELPGVQERVEGLYDEDGCLRTAVDDRDCSVTAQELDDALAGGDADDVRHLAGFTGSRWIDIPEAGAPVVLEDTVALAPGPTVELRGLVRNEGPDTVDAIEVGAVLRGPDGRQLAALSGVAAVGTVRRGEPVPFELTGPAVTGPVDRIEWSAAATTAEPRVRDLEWQPYWEQPAGARDPVDNYLYRESGPGPHPHVTFGSVRNVGADPASDVTVVAAWLGPDGRIAALAEAPVADPGGRERVDLTAGSALDAILIDAEVPTGAEALVWVSGS
jgi:hypothetical protein